MCVCWWWYSRKRHGGGGSDRTSRDEEAAHLLLEEQCNDLASELDEKVMRLKSGALEIGSMIRDDITKINDIEGDMSNAGNLLDTAFNQFDKMMATGGHSTMCKLAAFLFVVFIIFYFMLKSRQ